jgi:hypothetical protein
MNDNSFFIFSQSAMNHSQLMLEIRTTTSSPVIQYHNVSCKSVLASNQFQVSMRRFNVSLKL